VNYKTRSTNSVANG